MKKTITVNKSPQKQRERREEQLLGSAAHDTHDKYRAYLGSDRGTVDFVRDISSSLDRYTREVRKNLYAIVLPGGHGKSYYSEKLGLLDVDKLAAPREHNELDDMRKHLINKRSIEWSAHNKRWWRMANDQLDMMALDRPTVLLCHNEEFAMEVGAQVIGIAVLSDHAFEKNISGRTQRGKAFSRISREVCMRRRLSDMSVFNSRDELERWIINACNANSIPIACPYKYTRKFPNSNYADDLPEWVYTGESYYADPDELVEWHKQGKIPKECVDYFSKCEDVGAINGYGVTISQWSSVIADVRYNIGPEQWFDKRGDMMEIFPPESMMEKNRVNLTLRRLDSVGHLLEHEDVIEIMQHHVGERHNFVTGIVSHWKALGQKTALAAEIFPWYFVRMDRWSEVHKRIHNLMRISKFYFHREVSEDDRQALMYMELLLGKRLYKISPHEVIQERIHQGDADVKRSYDPDLQEWTADQYKRDFDVGLEEAHLKMRLRPRKVNVTSFVSFWKKSRTWVTKGSTVLNNLGPEHKKYVILIMDKAVERIEKRHNKTSLMEMPDLLSLLHADIDSFNETKIVPKYEAGKERALLPGTLLHYIVFSYILYFAERQEQVGSVRLNIGSDDRIEFVEAKMFEGLSHLLYDWSNFNTQHGPDEMAAVINKLGEVIEASADYAAFVAAIAESMYHMWVRDDEGVKHKVDKGLYSGWRGTTWINSVLNFVYLNIGLRCMDRIYRQDSIVYVDHGGDDVDIAMETTVDCVRLLTVMKRMGNVANMIKQMVDKKSEFYRNTIDRTGIYASPTRALANFISGNWEGMGSTTIREKVGALMDQIAKLRRRGVDPDFCNTATIASIMHWCRVKTEDKWTSLSEYVIHAPVEQNGLGVPDQAGMLWVLKQPIEANTGSKFWTQLPGVASSQDYVDEMERELASYGIGLENKATIVHKIAESSYDFAQYKETDDWETLSSYVGEIDYKKPAVIPMYNHDIFRGFMEYMALAPEPLELGKVEVFSELLGFAHKNGKLLTKKDLARIVLGQEIPEEVLDFKVDVMYRRLVPEYMAALAESYAQWALYNGLVDTKMAHVIFNTCCYMAFDMFELHA